MMSNRSLQQAIAAFKDQPHGLPLRGVVQHYDWGGHAFIPALLGQSQPARRPFAELWFGAHPKAPASTRIGNTALDLGQLIHGAASAVLGPEAAARFAGQLPYLFKVLDARKMLSIQAHPNRAQAIEGFARENSAGIKLGSAHRNYQDDNHKPEVQIALTEFWLLHGFRPLEQIAATLRAMPELSPLMPDLQARLARPGRQSARRSALLRELFQFIMTLPQARWDQLIGRLIDRLRQSNPQDKQSHDYWVLQAVEQFPPRNGHHDRGLLSIYLMNLVQLRPGQGTFQAPGTLHAFLQGTNVELMSNSDNVLRGGLTTKHVDVPELLRILDFTDGSPAILEGEAGAPYEKVFRAGTDEFALSCLRLPPGGSHPGARDHGAESLVVMDGAVCLRSRKQTMLLKRGNAVLVPFSVPYSLTADTEPATVFKAA